MRKKADIDDTISTTLSNDISPSKAKQNWDRLIQKIYEVDFNMHEILGANENRLYN